VLLLGYRLGPEYIPNLESIAAGLTYYNQLRLAKQATRRSALLTAVVVTLLALGVAAIAGQWVARGVSRPVENLVQGMQQLARGEPVRVSPSGTDELRFLTEAFNRMAQELDATRRELGKAERLAAWQEMARRIAHEIRNPLTPIQFALHRLQRMADSGRPPAPEAIQDSVSAILEEIEGLKTLAAAFSEFARLPDPEPVALQPNELVRSVAELADGQGARITLALAEDLPEIEGDRKGLRRVLTNLLRNALDSGAEEIIVRTRTSDGLRSGERLGDGAQLGPGSVRSLLGELHVVLSVEDTGPGVGADKLDKIFEPDYTTKPDGSGLGLAIVCRIVAQHGGALVVEPGDTRGIRMHVHLPLSRPDGMA
jgi:nitrogen fixation/metabolism regulation signal transduction histidine kinase